MPKVTAVQKNTNYHERLENFTERSKLKKKSHIIFYALTVLL
jgi:hypothetical protein